MYTYICTLTRSEVWNDIFLCMIWHMRRFKEKQRQSTGVSAWAMLLWLLMILLSRAWRRMLYAFLRTNQHTRTHTHTQTHTEFHALSLSLSLSLTRTRVHIHNLPHTLTCLCGDCWWCHCRKHDSECRKYFYAHTHTHSPSFSRSISLSHEHWEIRARTYTHMAVDDGGCWWCCCPGHDGKCRMHFYAHTTTYTHIQTHAHMRACARTHARTRTHTYIFMWWLLMILLSQAWQRILYVFTNTRTHTCTHTQNTDTNFRRSRHSCE